MHFYEKVIRDSIVAQHLDDSILVVCGTDDDAKVLRSIGFRDATITNLEDDRTAGIPPYKWAREDAENLSYADNSFDWVLVDAGLHHCSSPHKALLEMYRVCRKGLLALEARDSLAMRLAVSLKLAPQFEQIAVALNDYKMGGFRGGTIPNHIYRWTEREVRKTLETGAPHHVHDVRFYYGLRVPNYRIVMFSPVRRVVTWVLSQILRVVNLVARRQGNHFGWVARKTGQLKPWMETDGLHLRRDFKDEMDTTKYRGYFE